MAHLVLAARDPRERRLAGDRSGLDGFGLHRRARHGVPELEDHVEDLLAGGGRRLVLPDDPMTAGDPALAAQVDAVRPRFADRGLHLLVVLRLGRAGVAVAPEGCRAELRRSRRLTVRPLAVWRGRFCCIAGSARETFLRPRSLRRRKVLRVYTGELRPQLVPQGPNLVAHTN